MRVKNLEISSLNLFFTSPVPVYVFEGGEMGSMCVQSSEVCCYVHEGLEIAYIDRVPYFH